MLDTQGLAEKLDKAARTARPIAQITDQYPALTIADAYRIQGQAFQLRLARNERRIGMKMGLTSRAKMRQVNVDEVIAGVLSDAMLVEDGGKFAFGRCIHPRVEPEIAFRLGKPLTGAVGAVDVADAVEAVAPALEIIDSRYENFKFKVADVIADNSSAAGLVIGPWVRPDFDVGNLGMILSFDGKPVQVGSSAAILGHPLRSLIAAVGLAARVHGGLQAGDVVLAGAATAAEALRKGVYVRLRVQNLGAVSFTVSEDP